MSSRFHSSNQIHDTAIIEGSVRIGKYNVIGPYAVIIGPIAIGNHNIIHGHVSIGDYPEHKGFYKCKIKKHAVSIGSHNIIREFSTISAGFDHMTVIGSRNFIMNKCYVAHDTRIQNDVTLSSGVSLGGHCTVLDYANLGIGVTAHQRAIIGAGSMVGMNSTITKSYDPEPFRVCFGTPAKRMKVNQYFFEQIPYNLTYIKKQIKLFRKLKHDKHLNAHIRQTRNYRKNFIL